jgi:hypothetical protein
MALFEVEKRIHKYRRRIVDLDSSRFTSDDWTAIDLIYAEPTDGLPPRLDRARIAEQLGIKPKKLLAVVNKIRAALDEEARVLESLEYMTAQDRRKDFKANVSAHNWLVFALAHASELGMPTDAELASTRRARDLRSVLEEAPRRSVKTAELAGLVGMSRDEFQQCYDAARSAALADLKNRMLVTETRDLRLDNSKLTVRFFDDAKAIKDQFKGLVAANGQRWETVLPRDVVLSARDELRDDGRIASDTLCILYRALVEHLSQALAAPLSKPPRHVHLELSEERPLERRPRRVAHVWAVTDDGVIAILRMNPEKPVAVLETAFRDDDSAATLDEGHALRERAIRLVLDLVEGRVTRWCAQKTWKVSGDGGQS